ncbi:hypothetical protein CAK95_26980 [Pseudorhodoplanes sinuspersici]|uniref:Uncharacterized protein n=1 Tax=Pseudorhodoplanes sinuspersici TaxID=1235591 RepID=A0A1W6ZY71_9HYPH|nr:hypothetical protein CAK95_26980 [Pseudorhodoplanes sinuspersici]
MSEALVLNLEINAFGPVDQACGIQQGRDLVKDLSTSSAISMPFVRLPLSPQYVAASYAPSVSPEFVWKR